jgi:L-fucose isomerase-like protein
MTAPMVSTLLPASTLLALARRGLVEAAGTERPGERYATAHLAALRAAAAVLACRARPAGASAASARRSRPTSAWVLLATVAPELAEWAGFFAAGARKRAAAEAGLPSAVTPREADDLVRDAETFLAVVETTLGLDGHQLLLSG